MGEEEVNAPLSFPRQKPSSTPTAKFTAAPTQLGGTRRPQIQREKLAENRNAIVIRIINIKEGELRRFFSLLSACFSPQERRGEVPEARARLHRHEDARLQLLPQDGGPGESPQEVQRWAALSPRGGEEIRPRSGDGRERGGGGGDESGVMRRSEGSRRFGVAF